MANQKPLVSILMTAYNSQDFIGEAIESLLNQTFTDFEFLILNDGSSDKTQEIIEHYAKQDFRIKTFSHYPNQGIANSRNKLVSEASGKYIVWQDSDDISMSDRVADQVAFMEANPRVGISGGWLEFFYSSGKSFVRQYHSDDCYLRKKIFRYSPVAQGSSIIRAEAIKNLRYESRWDGTEDLDMSFKIGFNYQFANLPKVIVRYRQYPGSITYTRLKKLEKQTWQIRRQYALGGFYKMSLVDWLYNILQYLTIWLMPRGLRIKLFNILRSSGII